MRGPPWAGTRSPVGRRAPPGIGRRCPSWSPKRPPSSRCCSMRRSPRTRRRGRARRRPPQPYTRRPGPSRSRWERPPPPRWRTCCPRCCRAPGPRGDAGDDARLRDGARSRADGGRRHAGASSWPPGWPPRWPSAAAPWGCGGRRPWATRRRGRRSRRARCRPAPRWTRRARRTGRGRAGRRRGCRTRVPPGRTPPGRTPSTWAKRWPRSATHGRPRSPTRSPRDWTPTPCLGDRRGRTTGICCAG